jgi:hypothetical protein
MSRGSGSRTSANLNAWRAALALGAVVIAVVAALLTALIRTVDRIEAGAAEIWRVGKLIANNTIHIPLLVRTNQTIHQIVDASGRIGQAAERIRAAAAPATKGK